MTTRQIAALLLLALVWGASFLFIRVLVDSGMAPVGMSAGRTLIGCATLVPFGWMARRQFPRSARTWLALAGLGLFNFALPWTLFGYGEKHVASGAASVVNSAMPLWAAIFSVLLIRSDRLSPPRVAGLLLGFAGVVALVGSDFGDLGADSTRGLLMLVAATMCYGFSGVSVRRWLGHVPALPLTIGQVGFASLCLAPVALLTGAYDGAAMGPKEWASLGALGAAGSGLAVAIYMWLIGQVGAVRAAVVTYLMPPIGIFLGWLFLGERVSWNMVAGLALIVTGVALVQGVTILRALKRPARVAASFARD